MRRTSVCSLLEGQAIPAEATPLHAVLTTPSLLPHRCPCHPDTYPVDPTGPGEPGAARLPQGPRAPFWSSGCEAGPAVTCRISLERE